MSNETKTKKNQELVKVACSKCVGKGELRQFRHVDNGICFGCEGTGFVMVKPPKTKKTETLPNPAPKQVWVVVGVVVQPYFQNDKIGQEKVIDHIDASSLEEAQKLLDARWKKTLSKIEQLKALNAARQFPLPSIRVQIASLSQHIYYGPKESWVIRPA